jgi:hypothetical protein
MRDDTVRLTVAQAIVRYLANQFIEIDGAGVRLCGGGFGIFGHGNVTCLGEALYDHREDICRSIAARTSRAWALPRPPTPSSGCASASCSAPPRPVRAPPIC